MQTLHLVGFIVLKKIQNNLETKKQQKVCNIFFLIKNVYFRWPVNVVKQHECGQLRS